MITDKQIKNRTANIIELSDNSGDFHAIIDLNLGASLQEFNLKKE